MLTSASPFSAGEDLGELYGQLSLSREESTTAFPLCAGGRYKAAHLYTDSYLNSTDVLEQSSHPQTPHSVFLPLAPSLSLALHFSASVRTVSHFGAGESPAGATEEPGAAGGKERGAAPGTPPASGTASPPLLLGRRRTP